MFGGRRKGVEAAEGVRRRSGRVRGARKGVE